MMTFTSCDGTCYARSTPTRASLEMKSEAFPKSTSTQMGVVWCSRTSNIRWRAKIRETLPRWQWKPFCSWRRKGSMTDWSRRRRFCWTSWLCMTSMTCLDAAQTGFLTVLDMTEVLHSAGAGHSSITGIIITLVTISAMPGIRSIRTSTGTLSVPADLLPGAIFAICTTSAEEIDQRRSVLLRARRPRRHVGRRWRGGVDCRSEEARDGVFLVFSEIFEKIDLCALLPTSQSPNCFPGSLTFVDDTGGRD